jgi:hypothetical protein
MKVEAGYVPVSCICCEEVVGRDGVVGPIGRDAQQLPPEVIGVGGTLLGVHHIEAGPGISGRPAAARAKAQLHRPHRVLQVDTVLHPCPTMLLGFAKP